MKKDAGSAGNSELSWLKASSLAVRVSFFVSPN